VGVGARRAARRQRGFVTLFEDFRGPDLAARLRGIAIAPIAAIVISQLYATLYPLLPRVPAALFAAIDLILFGAAAPPRARRSRDRVARGLHDRVAVLPAALRLDDDAVAVTARRFDPQRYLMFSE